MKSENISFLMKNYYHLEYLNTINVSKVALVYVYNVYMFMFTGLFEQYNLGKSMVVNKLPMNIISYLHKIIYAFCGL